MGASLPLAFQFIARVRTIRKDLDIAYISFLDDQGIRVDSSRLT